MESVSRSIDLTPYLNGFPIGFQWKKRGGLGTEKWAFPSSNVISVISKRRFPFRFRELKTLFFQHLANVSILKRIGARLFGGHELVPLQGCDGIKRFSSLNFHPNNMLLQYAPHIFAGNR
ncbi:hypothetical protein [Parabacteroides sp. ZJ-118]|uniref:hypothetical protein n=1 Tax=Parabacteroides sp. ZJ-118 TaxID=2709398 RepID=UPI0013ED7240|nr:hypothetical protein [Parabacteroides sp. ZJ-118]